ncbi:MAG TPA: pepsin-like aspartic protease [Kofleriaceae bacterium]|jgi:hypothetical protein
MSRLTILALALAACNTSSNNGGADGGGSGSNTHPDAAPASSGYALMAQNFGLAYSVGLTVGGQQFQVITDTGSTSLGIASSTCSSCGVAPEYTPGSTAVDQHSTSTSQYGDSSMWTGENYADKVALTGDPDAVTMRFGAMTSQNGFFQQGESDQGILGFGGSGLAVDGTDAYTDKRTPGQFAFQLCPDDGTLWLGEADTSHESAAPQFAPMDTSEPYLMLDVTSASVGSASIGLSGAAVMDTGTSIMVLSTTVANKFVSAVNAAGFSTIFGQAVAASTTDLNCYDPGTHTRAQIDAALPPLMVTLPKSGGGSFTVMASASETYMMPIEGMYCFGVATVSGIPVTIMGDAFLRGFVTTFDLQNQQIGLASQVGCSLPNEAIPPDHVTHRPYRLGHPPAATAR